MGTVTKNDIKAALAELGILSTDTVIFHSSLKSFGTVDGGADTVIDAILEHLSEGTAVFPALRSRSFARAFKDWDINTTPSDVGLISETFRCRRGVLRSDNETHSVCALGRNAEYITCAHRSGEMRLGTWGNYAFGYNSPWQRMYELGGKVVMLGVTLMYNTFKHFPEHVLINDILKGIEDEATRREAEDGVNQCFDSDGNYIPADERVGKMWPHHEGDQAQAMLTELGTVRYAMCGECKMVSIEMRPFFDIMYRELLENPEAWVSPEASAWIKKYRR